MKIAIIIQARSGSSRLPGKVLMPLASEPLLLRILERVSASNYGANIIVATTEEAADDVIEELATNSGYACFRGHSTDLLDRHYKATKEFGADVVVKIPSDCPLIDPQVINRVIKYYIENLGKFDYVSNLHPATYPDGNDVEVMSFDALKTSWLEAAKDYEREHTTPFIWEQPDRFRIGTVEWEAGRNYAMSHRFTIDYAEDYEFITRVYNELWSAENPIFSLDDILQLLEAKPEIMRINSIYAGVNWYRNYLDELQTVSANETRQLV